MTPQAYFGAMLEAQERWLGMGFQAAEAWAEWNYYLAGCFGQMQPPCVFGRDETKDGMRQHIPTGPDLEDHYGRRSHDIDVAAV